MKIEVSADSRISENAIRGVSAEVESGLARFVQRLTRAEVHLKGIGESRPTEGTSCALEVRPANRDPVTVKHTAPSVEEAVSGAVDKMARMLDSTFGRIDDKRGGPSASGLPT